MSRSFKISSISTKCLSRSKTLSTHKYPLLEVWARQCHPKANEHNCQSERHYSPRWASASFKSFLHPPRLRATTVQFLHPSFAASSFTLSSQSNLGLPLVLLPPGSLRRTLLDKSSSSWRMKCPSHLNLLNLQNLTFFSPHN